MASNENLRPGRGLDRTDHRAPGKDGPRHQIRAAANSPRHEADRRLPPAAASVLAAGLLLLPLSSAVGAPDADPWLRWDRHVAGSATVVDHDAWDGILATAVAEDAEGVARVDYGSLSADPALRAALDGYLALLQATEVSALDRPEQMAFWINLYNALTVQVVRNHFPVDTIRAIDISPGLFSSGPWGATLAEVEGEALTLDDIEHRILRPLWRDSRVHYALNCASFSCPNLASRAWRADSLEDMLDAAARRYVNDPRGVTVENGELVVSRIYDWFEDDFGAGEDDVLTHLSAYAEPGLAREIARSAGIGGYRYDWSLNGRNR